jgi:subtilisin-like proprotein convertase family protein
MKLFKNLLALLWVLVAGVTNAQNITLSDADYVSPNELDCGTINPVTLNFSDGSGNYGANVNDTLVMCPDLTQGTKVSIAFAVNIGYVFDIDATDTLYVYDGPNTSAPLIGAYNSATNPTGVFVQASWTNTSGCLTLVFKSDGATQGQGWLAHAACDNPPQPFFPHIEAFKNGQGSNVLNPVDTGYVDVCFGDSILFVAKPTFPYAFEATGYGYSQNAGNCNYDWTIGGIGQFTNDSIWFKPPARSGYYVDLRITDIFPLIERITCKVRVSQQPIFTGTGPLEDSVCLGENTVLIGGVTPTDTVGVNIPQGEFAIGGIFAGLTFLPDGSGAQYSTTIAITGFDDTTTFQDPCDLEQLVLDIEHSYIGDLEIELTCPNGQSVAIMNAYNQTPFGWAELTPGGCGNSISTGLGNDTDIDGGAPGSPVYTYAFSNCGATQGSICNELGSTITNDNGNIVMDTAGVYDFDGSLNALIGCPINGNWVITVQDNQGIDDGYIFQWGLYFDASLYPDNEGYNNIVVSDFWSNDPSIISGQTDTLIVIQPNTPGYTYYTYNVVDDFGCPYDTTVSLFVRSLPSIFSDTIVCDGDFQVGGTQAFAGGVWSSPSSVITFSPNNTTLNPLIVPDTLDGAPHVVYFVDNGCQDTLSATVTFPPFPYTQVLDTSICAGSDYVIYAQQNSTVNSFTWYDAAGNQIGTGPSLTISAEGEYIVDGTNACTNNALYHSIDTATIDVKFCDITAPNIIVLSSQSGNEAFFVVYEGIKEFECSILNRWGNLIYEYFDPAGKWDGTSNGKVVDEGTYYYIIKAVFESGEEIKKHGFVQVKH